jgi:hypothetical protein
MCERLSAKYEDACLMLYFLSLLMQRLPLTLGFIGSMVATIYVSMVLHSYVLSVLFSVIQVSTFMLLFFFLFCIIILTGSLEFGLL